MNRRDFLALEPLVMDVFGLAIDIWYDPEYQRQLYVRKTDGLIVAVI